MALGVLEALFGLGTPEKPKGEMIRLYPEGEVVRATRKDGDTWVIIEPPVNPSPDYHYRADDTIQLMPDAPAKLLDRKWPQQVFLKRRHRSEGSLMEIGGLLRMATAGERVPHRLIGMDEAYLQVLWDDEAVTPSWWISRLRSKIRFRMEEVDVEEMRKRCVTLLGPKILFEGGPHPVHIAGGVE
jgi:hypothetical protein